MLLYVFENDSDLVWEYLFHVTMVLNVVLTVQFEYLY